MAARLPLFQRFQSDDPQALATKVEQDYAELAHAQQTSDERLQLEILSRLGSRLTILGCEQAAAPLLEVALILARRLEDQRLEVATLLHLATAQQYLDRRELAQQFFQEALEKARIYQQVQYEDFILHHRGRCYVEQGKIAEARACFEQALILRKNKGDERGITSTQHALDALASPPFLPFEQ